MDITEITDDMIGKKITCYIDFTFIDDGEITKEGKNFFILQNKRDGTNAYNKKLYCYSWLIWGGLKNDLKANYVKDIKLKNPLITPIELWI
jgi:hypothetical protein